MTLLPKALLLLLLILSSATAPAQELKVWKLADLQKAIAQADRPTVINFWATFCQPCLKEIPYFQQIVKKYERQGVQLILVSLDGKSEYPKKIQSVAQRFKFTAPMVFLNETNADLFCPVVDPAWSGAIPASIFINKKKGYRKFVEAEMSPQAFEAALRAML